MTVNKVGHIVSDISESETDACGTTLVQRNFIDQLLTSRVLKFTFSFLFHVEQVSCMDRNSTVFILFHSWVITCCGLILSWLCMHMNVL